MKKQKIAITGGLGYLGSELCKIYSGEARYKDIVVLDNRFLSERVKQLTDWGVTFVHGSILDRELLATVLKDADIVYHLAGITDVSVPKSQYTAEKNNDIAVVGVNGTRNVIELMPRTAKVCFPSTHVIFEGLTETKFDIKETETPLPILTYSKGKFASEEEIRANDLNHIIVRLGSVYGFLGDSMRINIMPNLFSKVASQNGTIELHSGGIQYKSMIAVGDVARAMKYLAESGINKETFNLSNENRTIREVAEICQKYNPNLQIVDTAHEIPNQGYTLCNQKLLSTGFEFLHDIDSCIKEMIQNWSNKPQSEDLEYIIKGGKKFTDERGEISNYELLEPINMIGMITSKRGTVRANHMHPQQNQQCLLVSGKYISYTKDLSEENAVIESRIIQAGDIAVIKPNVAHAMVFMEDSVFLNLVRGEREHANYGVTHTMPYSLVNEDMPPVSDMIEEYAVKCRCCGNTELKDVLSLGMSPLANSLTSSAHEKVDKYPLELKFCDNCKNVQLSYVVPADKMFKNYLYTSSTANSFRQHFRDAANKYINEFELNNKSLVIDIGSNDGVFLKPLMEKGIRVLGVEPAKNIADLANKNGIPTMNGYMLFPMCEDIKDKYGKSKLVTASNVFAHSDYLAEMAECAFSVLEPNGVFIVEVQYLLDTIKDLTFDNIYHEHVNYWSVTSLNNFFTKLGLCLYKVEHIDTHGGSIRAYIKRDAGWIDKSVTTFLNDEREFGMDNYETYRQFARDVKAKRENVLRNLKELKKQHKIIAAYGSPAKATTALNYFGVDNTMIDYTIEDNDLKIGKFIPGVDIPIVDKGHVARNIPDVIIVLAWNFFDEIVKNNQELVNDGIKFISIKDLQTA